MHIVAVTVFVKPEHIPAFIEATMDNATNTRLEPENIRFDVSQAIDDPARFFLYEVYQQPESFTKHQQTEHYLRWKSKVADWMAQPRAGIKHHPLFFNNSLI